MGKIHSYRFPFAAFPAVRIVFLFALGIVCAYWFSEYLSFRLFCISFIASASVWVVLEFYQKKGKKLAVSSVASAIYLVSIFLFGGLLYTANEYKTQIEKEAVAPINLYSWETVTIEGEILSSGWSQSGREIYEVRVEQTKFPDGASWKKSYKMRVYGQEEFEGRISSSATISADVRIFSFPEVRNPHDFDYGRWLIDKGIFAHGDLQKIHKVEKTGTVGISYFQEKVRNNIDLLFDEKHSSLAKALLIGYKQELTNEERQLFSRSGLSHIMAVSGLHVGFVVAPFWLIIPWLWKNNRRKWAGLVVLSLLLFGYAALTGFSASVSRASLMAWLLTYGKLFHKIRHSINLTGVAALILLIINPSQLFDVGFQLSFAAVFIILLLMPEAQRIIPQRHRFSKAGGLATIVIVSFIVQAGLFPILTYYFGEFSIIGPIANAFVIPVLSVTVPVGLLISIIGDLGAGITTAIAKPVGFSIYWIDEVAATFGGLESGFITFQNNSLSLYLIWLFAVFVLASIRLPAIRWKLVCLLLIMINLFLIEIYISKPSVKELEITVLDVGQGDAIHVQTPNGKHFLIDTGRWSPTGNSGESVLLPYLQHNGIKKLDAVLLSHPHADHIGGLPYLMRNFPIDVVYQSEYPYDSMLYREYTRLAKELEIPLVGVYSGDKIEIDPAIRLYVLGPDSTGILPRNPNNYSMVFRLQYGETSFLFSGDAEVEQERELVEKYGSFLNTNFLKMGHHGSRTSTTEIFSKAVVPEKSVASLALRNRFRHPNREAIANLNYFDTRLRFTSKEGAIIYRSNGEKIENISWK